MKKLIFTFAMALTAMSAYSQDASFYSPDDKVIKSFQCDSIVVNVATDGSKITVSEYAKGVTNVDTFNVYANSIDERGTYIFQARRDNGDLVIFADPGHGACQVVYSDNSYATYVGHIIR